MILAGGASERMGTPKPLLEIEGETFLDRLIVSFQPSCNPIIVVLGFHAEVIRAGSRRAGEVRFVLNPRPEHGQLSSLLCGIRDLHVDVAGVIFTPVDYPLVRPGTVKRIADEFTADGGEALVIVPTCEGRRGHPVCVSRDLFPEFLALPADAQAREVIHRHAGRTRYIEVGDPGILHDVDNPREYRRLLQRE